jgi:hypothetical protein
MLLPMQRVVLLFFIPQRNGGICFRSPLHTGQV